MEWIEGDFQDSAETLEGRMKHRRVDKEVGELPQPNISDGESDSSEGIHARSVLLSGEKCGLIARMDLIEGNGKRVSPVEYKRGKEPDIPDGAWPSDIAQICAQAVIIRENGFECDEGIVYYSGSKRRVTVPITEELVKWTLGEVVKARNISLSGEIPSPLVDSPKCPKCSLVSICLPDEVNSLIELDSSDQAETEIRRLFPSRNDALPVYVQEQGCTVTKRNEELDMRVKGKTVATARLMEISQLSLFGNVQVTTQAIHALCIRNIPICYFSTGGWFNAMIQGMSHKNVELRRRQYATAEDSGKSILVARKFIEGKIRNCRTLLRRNSTRPDKVALEQLQKLALAASAAVDAETLLGIEGSAGRVYFQHFKDMLKTDSSEYMFNFETRNRRPPRDPINAILSYVYAILSKDLTVTSLATGLDPFLGLYHRPRYGRPSLALDLMEEFRPIIGDSTVISMVNNSEITPNDFIRRGASTSLTGDGRKKVINAYERRMDTVITHPVFGYTVSYRRILEVQTRLVARWLMGEITEYPMFCTR